MNRQLRPSCHLRLTQLTPWWPSGVTDAVWNNINSQTHLLFDMQVVRLREYRQPVFSKCRYSGSGGIQLSVYRQASQELGLFNPVLGGTSQCQSAQTGHQPRIRFTNGCVYHLPPTSSAPATANLIQIDVWRLPVMGW